MPRNILNAIWKRNKHMSQLCKQQSANLGNDLRSLSEVGARRNARLGLLRQFLHEQPDSEHEQMKLTRNSSTNRTPMLYPLQAMEGGTGVMCVWSAHVHFLKLDIDCFDLLVVLDQLGDDGAVGQRQKLRVLVQQRKRAN